VGSEALSDGDRRIAAEAGIAVFADRLILQAQPPIGEETLQAVAARCSGPLPPALVALWRTSFGGELDYQLDGQISCRELFHPGSDGHQDLWGWIDHEAEIGGVDRLRFLPFGGFEYLDRLYVDTADGPDNGAVVYWQQGLPPGWELTAGDRADSLARDLWELFGQLALDDDPWAGDDPDAGREMRDAVDELGEQEPRTAAALRETVRAAVLDWRAALADGSLPGRPRLRRLALDRASAGGDVELLDRLAAAGCDLAEPVRGGLTAIDIAMLNRRLPAVEHLLDRGVPVVHTLRAGAHVAGPDLARRLIGRGAVVDADTLGTALEDGDPDVLMLLADGLSPSDGTRAFLPRLRMQAAQAEHAAAKQADGAGPDGDRARRRATVLRELADRFSL
jgi:hypothetical protein